MSAPHVTRKQNLLEPLLAQARARQANSLIRPDLRDSQVLDISYSSYPYFLSHTSFREKATIDQLPPAAKQGGGKID